MIFQMLPGGFAAISIKRVGPGKTYRSASHYQAFIRGKPVIVDQVAGIFETLKAVPTDRFKLPFGKLISCNHISKRGYLLTLEPREKM